MVEEEKMTEFNRESGLRKKLGIPAEAEQALIFGESSHWDPNWLLTSEEYYRLRTRKTLEKALQELEREPRRIYSVECVFFVKMFWERNPEKQETLRKLVNEGRLRFTGSGITTPDTIVPDLESIIRDYLLGQVWLEENSMEQRPRLAYLPDDFGLSPTLPTILSALGIEMAAVTRIDGSFFPGADYRRPRSFPRPGSSAELLQRELKTADFIWQGPDNARVLCHWNEHTYGQGDTLDLKGPVKWMGLYFGVPSRSEQHVAKRIKRFVKQLAPLARTPYMFCPIGFDFNDPIPRLLDLLEAYNRTAYQDTGVWAVNAALDDYLDLVSCYRERLPVLDLDLTPYWTGFYSSRPEMKQTLNRLSRDLVAAEKSLTLEGAGAGLEPGLDRDLKTAWEKLAVANHHDFITGTSPNRIWNKEQRPWLAETRKLADRIAARAFANRPASPEPDPNPPKWNLEGGKLVIETEQYRMTLEERAGGCITSWIDNRSGAELLQGLGNDLVCYLDSGGLWQMGYEFNGGEFRPLCRASDGRAFIRAEQRGGSLLVSAQSELEGKALVREMWFGAESPLVKMRLRGSAGRRRTITCHFSTGLGPVGLHMDVPGGVVHRPLQKIYNPTFWGAKTFAHLLDRRDPFPGLAAFMGGPASVSANSHGGIEWVALRNAPRERAFGFLPVPSCPAFGPDPGEHEFVYAVMPTPGGSWRENRLHLMAEEALAPYGTAILTDTLVKTDAHDVKVIAVKPAWLGAGVIVRLQRFDPARKQVLLSCASRPIARAWLCDARERDIQELILSSGGVSIPLGAAIVTVRIIGG